MSRKRRRRIATPEQVAERTYLAAEQRETARVLAALRDLWREVSGLDWHPKDQILRPMLGRYDPWVVAEAVAATAPRVASGYLKGYDWRPYLWGVARRTVEQVEQAHAAGAEGPLRGGEVGATT